MADEAPDGQVTVEVLYCSLDPAMRTWLNAGRSYVPPVGLGEVMWATGIGRVLASGANGFSPGDIVSGLLRDMIWSGVPARRHASCTMSASILPSSAISQTT